MDLSAACRSAAVIFSCTWLIGVLFLPRTSQAADPTGDEVEFVYHLNWARNDPEAWAELWALSDRIGGDGQPADLVGVEPRPPLAISEILVDSARIHSNDMGENDFVSHESTTTGKFPNERIRDEGYPLPESIFLEGLLYEIPDTENYFESLAAGYGGDLFDFEYPLNVLMALIVDTGVDSLGHRKHLLGDGTFLGAAREVGVGYADYPSSTYRNYWTIHTGFTENLDNFLTGVVYRDDNQNDFYDSGEGLGGVTVMVNSEYAQTGEAGNWALAVPDGNYEVSCSGGAFEGIALVGVGVSGSSRAVDCVSGFEGGVVDFVRVPEPTVLVSQAVMLLVLAGAFRRRS